MKVSIIGGGGLVGSCAGFALQAGKLVREIVLVDANADMAAGQALDLMHGSSVMADQVIRAGDYEHIPESDCVCITAGLRRKPDESRLGSDQSQRGAVQQHSRRDAEGGAAARRRRAGRFQPGRHSDVPGGQAAGLAGRPGHRPGHALGHDPFSQPDRRAAFGAAHASFRP